MSMMSKHALVCPKCGHKQSAAVWDCIDISTDPVLREELFAGDINAMICASCGTKTVINVPLFYHDAERRFCAQYYPPDALDDEAFFKEFSHDGSLLVNEEGIIISGNMADNREDYLKRPHIVFNLHELLRYIIFREKVFGNES